MLSDVFTEARVIGSSLDWYTSFQSSSQVSAARDAQRRTMKPGACRKADSPRYEEQLLWWLKMGFHHPLPGLSSQCEERWPRDPAAPEGVPGWKRSLQGVCGGGSELPQGLRKPLECESRPGARQQCSRSLPASGSRCPEQPRYDVVSRERGFLLWSQLVFLVWARSSRVVQMPVMAAKNRRGGSQF